MASPRYGACARLFPKARAQTRLRAILRSGAAPCAVWLLLLATVVSRGAKADAEVHVSVRGKAHIEANATTSLLATELAGRVTDDAGRPVAFAAVVIGRREPDAKVLPRPQACDAGARAELNEATGQASVITDADGRFCLRFVPELGAGRLSVRFEDSRRLLDAGEADVELRRAAALDIAFVPAPRAFAAEDAEATVVIQARRRTLSTDAASVELTWQRAGEAPRSLARGELFPNEALRLSFAPKALGQPGNGELVASAELGTVSAQARALVPLVARVELNTVEAAQLDAQGRGSIQVAARAVTGQVNAGSVEALAAGRTVGIATVVAGRADVALALAAQPGTTDLTLRYLPASPWFAPGAVLRVSVHVPEPSAWQRLPWALGLLAVAGWILAAWRRPQHRELPTTRPRHGLAGSPALEWVAAATPAREWTGRVSDAHDGTPLAHASVTLAWPHGASLTTRTNVAGEFGLPASDHDVFGAEIRVEAPWHAPLVGPLPPPGRLHVSLVTRRRELLSRFATWARARSPEGAPDPTPGQVLLQQGDARPLAGWLQAVESAAYGPEPVDAERETNVRQLEPVQVPEAVASARSERQK